jgi:hypothetical protein
LPLNAVSGLTIWSCAQGECLCPLAGDSNARIDDAMPPGLAYILSSLPSETAAAVGGPLACLYTTIVVYIAVDDEHVYNPFPAGKSIAQM